MVVRRATKDRKYRGSNTHGGGSKKKRRGAGNRGGRGNAGRGKRSDHKKPGYIKNNNAIGRKGFTSHSRVGDVTTINVGLLQSRLEQYVAQGKVEKKGDVYVVDVEKLGYDKVLGSGHISVKVQITAAQITERAAEKIVQAGGQVASDETVSAEE